MKLSKFPLNPCEFCLNFNKNEYLVHRTPCDSSETTCSKVGKLRLTSFVYFLEHASNVDFSKHARAIQIIFMKSSPDAILYLL